MADSTAYLLGRFFGGLPKSLYVIVFTGGALWLGAEALGTGGNDQKAAPVAKQPTSEERCRAQRDQQMADYRAKLEQGLPWQAATAIRVCSAVLKDAEMQALVVDAESADAEKTAVDKSQPATHRVLAIERLEGMSPERGNALAGLKVKLEQEVAREQERNRRAIAAQKRKEGVRLGMSQEDVLASSWGRPQRVNKSIYSFGVHEQWVYGGRNYLYFKDGVLDSVQTGD